MQFSALGPHCADGYHASARQAVWRVRDLLNPLYLNILRASNPNEALHLANEITNQSPTQVMVRHHYGPLAAGDERVLHVFPHPRDYFEQIALLYKGTKLILVVGNEITLSSYHTTNAAGFSWLSYNLHLMRWLFEAGVRGAFGRFPAWHPDRAQFGQFDGPVTVTNVEGKNPVTVNGLKHAFQLWPTHLYSPNWYVAPGNTDAIDKGIEFWQHIGKPPICVGEFGWIADPTAARSGFRVAMSQRQAANWHADVWRDKLRPHGIPACWYNMLTWTATNTFQTDDDFVDELVKRRADIQINTTIPEVPPMSEYPDLQPAYTAILTIPTRLRQIASTTAQQPPAPTIAAGTKLSVAHPKVPVVRDTYTWVVVKVLDTGAGGWMAYHDPNLFTKIELPTPTPPPGEMLVSLETLEALQGALRQMIEHHEAIGNHLQILIAAAEDMERTITELIERN